MDVQLSADGRAVVIHDTRVNRTTDGKGSVSNLTLRELKELDAGRWFDRRLALRPGTRRTIERIAAEIGYSHIHTGEGIPTLDAVMEDLLPENLKRIYIELKGSNKNREALVDSVVSLIHCLRIENRVTLLSFDHEAVRIAREKSPGIRTAATFAVSGRALVTTRSVIRSVEDAGVDEAALHYSLISRRIVTELHERRIAVSAWTANRPIVMRRLVSSGVDAIMTDFPNRLKDVISSPNSRGLPNQRIRKGKPNR
jgi:glycerophosphoryl diester phosphodiesterase